MGSCQGQKKESAEKNKLQQETQIQNTSNSNEHFKKSIFSQSKSACLEKKSIGSVRQSVREANFQFNNSSLTSPIKARMSTPIVEIPKMDPENNRSTKHKTTFKMNATVKKSAFSKFYSVQQDKRGSFSRVAGGSILVQHNQTGKLRYADYLDNSVENKKYVQELLRCQLQHPNIVSVIEILEEKQQYVVIKECVQGQPVSYSELVDKQLSIIKQIIEAVLYLHSKELCHGALWLGAFEKNDDIVKLVDLKSIFVRHEPTHHDIEYLSPECSNNLASYTKERDVWALGMMINNIINGKYFKSSGVQDVMKDVEQIRIKKHIHIGTENKELLERFLHITPEKRILLTEVFQDPYFNQSNKSNLSFAPIIERNKHLTKLTVLQQCLLLLFINQFEEQNSDLHSLFKFIDSDHDGKISKKDCQKAFPGTEDSIASLFNILSISDKMNFQEFLVIAVDKSTLLTEQNIETIFNLYSTMKKCIQLNTLVNIYQSKENELTEQFSDQNHPYIYFNTFETMMKELLIPDKQ